MTESQTTAYASRETAGDREATQLTGRDVFKVLFRRKWIILILFVTTAVFVVWKASRIPTEYRATAEVLINRGQRKSALDRNVSLLTWDETVATELQIAESRPVIDAAQKALDEQAGRDGTEPIVIAPAGVYSRLLGESNVVGIEYRSLVESEVQPVANALADAYIKYHKKLFALPDATEFFDTRVVEAEKHLKDLTYQRQAVQEKGEIIRLTTQQDNLITEIRGIRDLLLREESEYAALEMEVIEAKRLISEEGVDIPFDARTNIGGVGPLQVLYQEKNKKLALERKKAELLARYTEQHPDVVAVENEIRSIEDDIARETEQIVTVKETYLAVERAKINDMRQKLADLMNQLHAIPEVERNLQDLDRSIKLANDAYAELLENQVRIQVAEVSSRDFTLSLLSKADEPTASNPRDPIRLALVPAFSLLVGISLAFFIETMDHSLKGREDAEHHLALSVLASIPNRKKPLTS